MRVIRKLECHGDGSTPPPTVFNVQAIHYSESIGAFVLLVTNEHGEFFEYQARECELAPPAAPPPLPRPRPGVSR